MKTLKILLASLLISYISFGQLKHGFRDESGRHEIPRGYVVNTEDGMGEIFYTANDYARMTKMGANYQVIRLALGKIVSYKNSQPHANYLLKLDSLVQLGKNSGIKSVFKMTVYGIEQFSWEELFLNKKGEQEIYRKAWQTIMQRYKDEAYVTGYDLVNEPRKHDMQISYTDLTNTYLVPLYQTLIDDANKITTSKKYFVQDIFMNKGEAIEENQYAEITKPINRTNVVFTPHIYQNKKQWLLPMMARFDREAKLLSGPMLVGEWGFPTFDSTDSLVQNQLKYMDFYIRTAEIFDSLGIGTIKAWFTGNRVKQHFLSGGPSTWAIFEDEKGVGTIERKYITDIIARPYPQSIAGDIKHFKYDFATRSLEISLLSDNSKGASRIFIGANRHYPDGFSVVINEDFILYYNPLNNKGLEVFKITQTSNPADFIWDDFKQQLIILKWPIDKELVTFKIIPGN
jgi:endoglycosylceramidase